MLDRFIQLKPLHKNLLCFVLGVMGAIALPPTSLPVFFLIGCGAFVFLLKSADSYKQCFAHAWCYAVGFHLAGLYWISASLFVDIQRYFWVLPFSLLALPAYLGVIFAGACCAAHHLRHKPMLYVLTLACSLFISELFRGWFMGGFPWNAFGYIWANTLSILQSASLFGIHGLTLLTLLAATACSFLFTRLEKSALILLASIGIIFSCLALWGMERLTTTATTYHDTAFLRLVQPNIQQYERRTEQQRIAALSKIIELSKQKSPTPITHIIWPETASPFFLNQDADARAVLKHIVPKGGALLTGTASRVIENNQRNYFNSLVIMDDHGRIIGNYDKAHLVPFGEFIPLRSILKMVPVAADVIGTADFTAGDGAKTLRAPGMPSFSTMICYEAIFSGAVVDEHDRPQALLHITNDAWFGDTSGPYQHLAMARVRAIEEGLPLIRVANSGISAVIDPLGRIVQSLPLNTGGVIDSSMPKALHTPTLFIKMLPFFK